MTMHTLGDAPSTLEQDWRARGLPTFRPWMGEHYRTPTGITAGRRLLVLGESHYVDENERGMVGTTPPGFTRTVVEKLALAERPYPFFDKIARLVAADADGRITRDRTAEFWQSVAFCNFVPVIVGENRVPDQWMFKAGTETVQSLLDELEPEVVIACGIRLWDYFAPNLEGYSGPAYQTDVHDDGRAIFGKFYHPSARKFRLGDWAPRARRLLDQAGKPRMKGHGLRWSDLGA
ncbi:hypothetical protein [Rubellimicrobium aerolatum]|uniref:Uracil-DNA glycosylase n=1 Tax=Rubellimicrobium aerolatum TaxID=490979 RepID=A0ABW0SBB9_9RHOB|nr:hypothetical protein [Rubellimicrobium aerolatum]MBP1805527.1 hypothetical protein [Rubellimicrobium aerolatum]